MALFKEVILGNFLIENLITFHFTFEINVIVFRSTIKISFIVVLILQQVLLVTLWLKAGKVKFLTSFWCKSSTTFHFTIKISYQALQVSLWLEVGKGYICSWLLVQKLSFIVIMILYQLLQATLWLEVGKVTFSANFWCKS